MNWNYAELSKDARVAGGPEKLVEQLIEEGKEAGRREMYPIIVVAAAAGAGTYVGVQKIRKYFKKKRMKAEEIEAVKEELINGIYEYDAVNECLNEISIENNKDIVMEIEKKEGEESER